MHPYVNTAIKAARAAGNIIMRGFDDPNRLDISSKTTYFDLVSNIDRAAEFEIRRHINKAYPTHSILGEEGGLEENAESNIVWIIDPLDGTVNFIRGIPHFCVSIAIMEHDELMHGVIFNPCNGELFAATKGKGAQRDGKRIRVSECNLLEQALIATNGKVFTDYAAMRHMGSAALDLAYVACGRFDAYIDQGLARWDIAAGMVIVREAGGYIGDLTGDNHSLEKGEIVATNRKIYSTVLSKVNTNC
jgi:myo-inositol-1(or 4)-monophosphatase